MPKESPLIELHRANGAEFLEQNGWLLPHHFGNPEEEYRAARHNVAMLDLCHRSLICLLGPDRLSYLQGMVSNDVKALAPGTGLYAAVLDVNGKILADLRVFCAEDCFLLDLWEPLKEKVISHLDRYLVADEVEIKDLTENYGVLSLQGPKARLLLTQILSTDKLPSVPYSHRIFRIGDVEVRVARASHTGEDGFDLIVETKDLPHVAARIAAAGRPCSLRWIGIQAMETLRVEAGILLYGIDMDEERLLLETGLEHAVSYQKGCYLGQEVIERIRSRGHVNRKLLGLLLDGARPAHRRDKIFTGQKEVGEVTSSVFSPARDRPIALGYVHRDYWQPGSRLAVHSGGDTLPAVAISLPFYKSASSLETTQELR